MDYFRQCIRQAASSHIVDRQDWIRIAHLPAAVDDLLRAALDLGVAALDRIEIEIGGVGASDQRRSCSATHPDQHSRTSELNEQRPRRQLALMRIALSDVADATGDHDRLVIAAPFASDLLLEGPEISEQVRTPELVVERGAANRTVEHDLQSGGDALRLARVDLPRLREPRNAQMRNGESGEPCFRLGADPGRALVANFTAGARGGPGKRRDGSRMIVRLDLHKRAGRLALRG